MAKKSRGWMAVRIADQPTIRELERDHEECEGCGRRDKPVFSYLGRDGEPIVCSKACFERALVLRFGGVRKPTRAQAAVMREREAAKTTKTGIATVVPIRRVG